MIANKIPHGNIKKDSGTTNITGLNWVQRGKVVSVSFSGLNFTPYSGTVVTGLPKPVGYANYYAQSNTTFIVVGYVGHDGTNWLIGKIGNGGTAYGQFTYLTDE